ncbi:flagellar hook-length control protein FliK [Paenibacillus caui]|uniref:flagellar hook-length control protein FliK n=1 Tax=Paenibacillus caui TaxID=2873927 RepID=UPI001F445C70|nr:flagellar hook-length control protein FliK [Paenibacillus caui]
MSTIPGTTVSAPSSAGKSTVAASNGKGQEQAGKTSSAIGAAENANSSTAANGSDKGKSVAGSGSAFGKTLLQYILNPAASAEAASADDTLGPNLAESLTGLAKGESAAGTGLSQNMDGLQNILDALSELLQNNSELDQAIASDPALIAQLQSWIQQAMLLLQGTDAAQMQQASEGGNGTGLSLLASQPETLRFAVQDTLHMLKEQLNRLGSQGSAGSASFSELIQSLQKTLGQFVKLPSEQIQQPGQHVFPISGSASGEGAAHAVVTAAATAGDENPADQHDAFEGNGGNSANIVTAGQLQLRDGSAAPAKVSTPVPVERFAQEMTGFVVSKLDIVKLQGMSEAKISLFPEHLGHVDVRITLHNGQVVAQFITEHAFAKDSLEQQMTQLRAALQSQGLQVEKLEVTQNSSLSSQMYQDGRQSGAGSQQRQNNKRRETGGDEALATLDTMEEWNEWVREVQSKQADYGSSFIAKA